MHRLFKHVPTAAVALLLAGLCRPAHATATLDKVRSAGTLTCGVNKDEDDYSEADRHGDLTKLGADLCRALAAEIFGNGDRARFLTLRDEPEGLRAVRDGRIDVLFGATPDPVIGQIYKAAFGPPIFIDGQGFLVANRSGIRTVADLAGKLVCFINAAPPEQMLYDALDPHLRIPTAHFPFSERGEMEVAMMDGHCNVITGDISWMANIRASFGRRADGFAVLPDTITTDPFSPAFRDGDPQWASLVSWTVWALLQAEEHGVTRANVVAMRTSTDPIARRLAGTTPWIAKALGIGDDGFAHAIAAVGNYGELFDRDVGAGSRLQLPRGRSQLAVKGGLLWALPVEPLQ